MKHEKEYNGSDKDIFEKWPLKEKMERKRPERMRIPEFRRDRERHTSTSRQSEKDFLSTIFQVKTLQEKAHAIRKQYSVQRKRTDT
jgi:hypothetical protein